MGLFQDIGRRHFSLEQQYAHPLLENEPPNFDDFIHVDVDAEGNLSSACTV